MLENKALLTDLYQFTMSQAYWQTGKIEEEGCFYLHFRENPFHGGYSIACGMAQVAEIVTNFAFTDEDIVYLGSLPAPDGTSLFDHGFLDTLKNLRLSVDIDAVKEGTVVFPYEPLVRVTGPIMQCQLLETALLNCVNFETLIATKAARVCQVAQGPVAEFGQRRAQGPMGGNLASRAAIVGGCLSTSNTMAGKLYGIPVSGTHAHSWVMAHSDELEAFRAYAAVMPHNCVLLVDTYDVLEGVRNAIIVAREMEQRGQRMRGIRIDSGDLAWLSIQARELLDAAGLDYVNIIASNDLDEYTIQSLHDQGARIDAWGVGTRLATAFEQPSLGGVYKLCATRRLGQGWIPSMKVSEQIKKATLPGILEARRYFDTDGIMVADMVYDQEMPPTDDLIIDPFDDLRRKSLAGCSHQELLEPLARDGKVVLAAADMDALASRQRTLENLEQLHPTNKRFLNPHSYPVGVEAQLLRQRDTLLKATLGIEG
jgi:nicotinate phosphoribosyltransferase